MNKNCYLNNILDYDGFINIETSIIENEINEKKSGGIRGFLNRRAGRLVKSELSEEIEMSKGIVDGIKDGLETLSDDFGNIKDALDKSDDNNKKGERQKQLNAIIEIIEKSKKTSWDINELIDEGEIDYSGFSASVGLSMVRYFGAFLLPFRSTLIIHKGYRYFFSMIKNTIRKSLVMLQLNFDQFENLIITKSFQSDDYRDEMRTSEEISNFFGQITSKLFDKDKGSMSNKKNHKEMEASLNKAYQAVKIKMEQNKHERQAYSAYNNLDPYTNTYTKSLETLRQYTQDDVQKQLDAIKTSMTKLAGKDDDMVGFSEMVIATAEEHALKVSSAIYNRFAKMTEVFSLPNQAKLLKLIQSSAEEQEEMAEKERKEKTKEIEKQLEDEKVAEMEREGSDVFTKKLGGTLGEMKEYKYDSVKVDDSKCNYDEIFGKNLTDDDREALKKWFNAHPEVWEKCEDSVKIAFPDFGSMNSPVFDYCDIIIDKLGEMISTKVNDSLVMSFDNYINEGNKNNAKSKNLIIYKKKDDDFEKLIESKNAIYAFKTIGGEDFLDNREFQKRSEDIIDTIKEVIDKHKKNNPDNQNKKASVKEISSNLYRILTDAISTLRKLRNDDYSKNDGHSKRDEEEKSE